MRTVGQFDCRRDVVNQQRAGLNEASSLNGFFLSSVSLPARPQCPELVEADMGILQR
jgi:hypothetical protein